MFSTTVTFVAATNLLGYMIGSGVEILCCVAILAKTKRQKQSDLILIVSLACANAVACWSSIGGCFASLCGRHFHPYSSYAIGFCQSFGWLAGALHMNALAFNRLAAILMPLQYEIICSPRVTLKLSMVFWVFALCFALLIAFFGYPIVWNLNFVNALFDFSHPAVAPKFVTVALDVLNYTTYTVAVGCYVSIILKLIHLYFTAAERQSRPPDMRLCVQFFLIFVVFVLQARSWTILSWLGSEYWYIIDYLTVANFTINGYIYMIFNKTIRGAVKKLLGFKTTASVVPAATQAQAPKPGAPLQNRWMPPAQSVAVINNHK